MGNSVPNGGSFAKKAETLVGLTGVYLLFVSCLGLFLSVMTYYGLVKQAQSGAMQCNPLAIFALFLPFVLCLAATGAGLLKFKEWARFALLILSGLAIVVGVFMCAALIRTPLRLPGTVPPATVMMVKGLLFIVVFLFLFLLPLFFLAFFTRSNIAGLFGKRPPSS